MGDEVDTRLNPERLLRAVVADLPALICRLAYEDMMAKRPILSEEDYEAAARAKLKPLIDLLTSQASEQDKEAPDAD